MTLPDRLPSLTGHHGAVVSWVYRALIAAALLLGIAGLGVNAVNVFRDIPQTASFGFRVGTDTVSQRVAVGSVAPRTAKAGVRPGDRIVAIDGHPIAADASEMTIGAALARTGATARLAVVAPDGRVRTATLKRDPQVWARRDTSTANPLWLVAAVEVVWRLLFVGFLLLASLLLHRRRPRDAEAMLLAFAFPLLTTVSVQTWWLQAVADVPAGVTRGLSNLGWVLLLVAMAGFPDGRFSTRLARGTMGWLLLFAPIAIGVRDGLLFGAMLIVALALVLATVLDRYRATPPGDQRQQMRWAVLGFVATVIALLVGIVLEAGKATVEGTSPITYFVNVATRIVVFCGLPAGLLVSQLRYRLYDADAAISRSAAYGALTLALLAIFAASEKILEVAGERWLGEDAGALAAGLAAAVAAVAIAPLHHRVSHWAEHRFQRALIRLRHGLPLLVGDLRETADAPAIADAALARVTEGVRARAGAIVAEGRVIGVQGVDPDIAATWLARWTPDDAPACDPADPLFPVRLPLAADGIGTVGWLLLGVRPDGSLYGKDERAALTEIAEPLARALAVARVRTDAAARRDAETQALSTRLANLEKVVARLTGTPSPGLATG